MVTAMEMTWKAKAEELQAKLEAIRFERDMLQRRCDEIIALQLEQKKQVLKMLREALGNLADDEDVVGAPD